MELEAAMNQVIKVATDLKSDPATDKRWLNTIIKRQEESKAFIPLVTPGRVHGIPESRQPMTGAANTAASGCICPAGVVDVTCPIHGNK